MYMKKKYKSSITKNHKMKKKIVLSPAEKVHISKTILAMVMKFCGWIDLIKGECSAH